MSIPSVLAALTLLVGVPLNVFVTVRLWRLSLAEPRIRVLRERAIVATAVLVLVMIFAFVFLNNDFEVPIMSFSDTKYLTRIAMLLVSVVPASYWLVLYR